ncbi:MAG TPA: hypothetical protein VF633_07545, partial [Brevundimonas sp.]
LPGAGLMLGLGLAVERAFRLSATDKGYWLAIWLMASSPRAWRWRCNSLRQDRQWQLHPDT